MVIEGATGRLPRGRSSTLLRLNDERVIIGVDIRPTQTTVALADVNGRFTSQDVMATASDPTVAINALIERIQRIVRTCGERKIEGIGISVPGRVAPDSGRLVFAPNLAWPEVDLRTPIANVTGLTVELENAANACVLAAVWFDRIEGCRNLVVLTISEGIGTGLFVNGQLVRGHNGMAGEFGHISIDLNGPECKCGNKGCWEVFAANGAAVRYYLDAGPPADRLSFQDLLTLADEGDTRAVRALERMAHYLGRGMRMIVAGLAPERIILVGDLTRSWHRFGPVIEAEVQAQVLRGGCPPRLIPAYEDGMARLRGTVALVLQRDFGVSSESA